MLAQLNERKKHGLFWAALLIVGTLIVWLAPEEQTLGQGIRSVYIHVALTWVGMVGLALAGLLGLALILWASGKLAAWMRAVGWVGLAFYAAGLGMSVLASSVNWGNVFWQEPRMRSASSILAAALIVQVLIGWLSWQRLRGLLSLSLMILLGWSTLAAPLVLHPRNAVGSSTSTAIRLTFLVLSLLFGSAAAWITWQLKSRIDR